MKNLQTPGSQGHALVLQHHPDEHPGSLGPTLEDAGLTLSTVELDAGQPIPALDPFDLLVVMGGPQQVWEEDEHPWLVDEKAVIRHWVGELHRPFLGVCLGHQLLADAMGGRVARMETPEIGVHDIRRTSDGAGDPFFRLPSADLRRSAVARSRSGRAASGIRRSRREPPLAHSGPSGR